MPCPLCGKLLALTPHGFESHYRNKHPGETAPDLRRKREAPPTYTDAETFLIENATARRERRLEMERKHIMRYGRRSS